MHGSKLVALGYGRVIGVKATWRRRADERLFPLLVVAGERTQGLQDVELRCPPAHAGDAGAEVRGDALSPASASPTRFRSGCGLCSKRMSTRDSRNPTPRTRSRVTRPLKNSLEGVFMS